MTYLELAKRFKGHKSGRRIAIILLKNRMKKGAPQAPSDEEESLHHNDTTKGREQQWKPSEGTF